MNEFIAVAVPDSTFSQKFSIRGNVKATCFQLYIIFLFFFILDSNFSLRIINLFFL